MKEIIAKSQNKEVDTHPSPAVVNTALRSVAERDIIVSAPAKQDTPTSKDKELSFFDIGISTGTDKVLGEKNLPLCLKDDKDCGQPQMIKDECKYNFDFVSISINRI